MASDAGTKPSVLLKNVSRRLRYFGL